MFMDCTKMLIFGMVNLIYHLLDLIDLLLWKSHFWHEEQVLPIPMEHQILFVVYDTGSIILTWRGPVLQTDPKFNLSLKLRNLIRNWLIQWMNFLCKWDFLIKIKVTICL